MRVLAVLITSLLTAVTASAQTWPSKPITFVVPFPPGGSTDQVARAVGPKITERFGQTVIVDNRAGATGTLGAGLVKRSAADGYTFMVTSLGPLVIAPHIMKTVPYDAQHDFDFITVAVQAPNVLVVPPSSPFKSVAELVAKLKAQPGRLTFASSGSGSSDHLTAELFWQQTGTTGSHIPYKGGAPAIQDLLGGQVDASFQNVNAVLQHIKAGKLRALAVTGQKRSPVLPDVATMAELGVKGVDVYSWQAIVAPKGLPPAVKDKFHAAVIAALNDPRVKTQFTTLGLEVVANSESEFSSFQQREFARWKTVIEAGKITAD